MGLQGYGVTGYGFDLIGDYNPLRLNGSEIIEIGTQSYRNTFKSVKHRT